MPDRTGLRHGPLGPHAAHLCVDMQRMFAEPTSWHTPWMRRVLPVVERIARAHPARTVFTRFIPADRPGEGAGAWRRYYERWPEMTVARLGRERLELLPPLAALVPPARVLDKRTYSPWIDPTLLSWLRADGTDTLVMTGGETDVCVLATVLGAVDHGFRVVVAEDAVCSSSDQTHDAMITLYRARYGQQVETADAATILAAWTAAAGAADR